MTEPATTLQLTPAAWNDVLWAARTHGLTGRLASTLDSAGLLNRIPAKAHRQLRAAMIAVESTHTAIRFELHWVRRALASIDTPIILLKGAAYLMANLPALRGRYIGDLDLMVPKQRIAEVEQALLRAGWASAPLPEYDQRYYREWTHEIPPMQHPARDTTLDIHHTIIALTSRFRPDAAALFQEARPIATTRFAVLCPADIVLHGTVHLINDEVAHPLRDLFDIDELLRDFRNRPGFWDDLLARAALHGFQRPLYHVLRQARRIIGTPIPPQVESALARHGPNPVLRAAMDWLFARHFAADPPHQRQWGAAFAGLALYLRAHYLRMPLPLLTRHLAYKTWRRLVERSEAIRDRPETPDKAGG